MSKLQHEIGLRYKTNKQKQYRELTRTECYINHYVLGTELIINAGPVFYCIDTVMICNRVDVQYILKKSGYAVFKSLTYLQRIRYFKQVFKLVV
jgi:hypothetical protein